MGQGTALTLTSQQPLTVQDLATPVTLGDILVVQITPSELGFHLFLLHLGKRKTYLVSFTICLVYGNC